MGREGLPPTNKHRLPVSVSAKIRTLSEFHTRILCNQQPPSNAEIVTTLRYFQQTLVRCDGSGNPFCALYTVIAAS